MSAEDVRYEVHLDGVDKFQSGMQSMEHSANALHHTVNELKSAFIEIFAVEKIFEFGKEAYNAFTEANVASSQLNATLVSTKYAAGITREELDELTESTVKNSLYTDEAVTSMQSLLLTFTSIGKEVIPQAQQAIADMSAKMGTDLNGTAIQVGKALQDPIHGIAALHRVGVNFSEGQKQVIKQLVETGKVAEAQRLILKELNTEFGGSAEAAKKANPVKYMQNQLEELMEKIGGGISKIMEGLMPIAEAVLTMIAKFVDTLEKSGIGNIFKNLIDVAFRLFGIFQQLGAMIIEAFKPLKDDIEPIFELIFEYVNDIIDAFQFIMPVLKPILHLIGELAHIFIVIVIYIDKTILRFIEWLSHTKIFKAVWDAIVLILEKVVGFIERIVGGIKSLLGIKDTDKKTTNPSEKLEEARGGKGSGLGGKISTDIQPTSQAEKVTGTKQVIINVNIQKLVELIKIMPASVKESASEMEKHVTNALLGAVNQFSASADI